MKSLIVSLALAAIVAIAPTYGEPAPAVETPIEHITPIEAPATSTVDGVCEFDVMTAFEHQV